VTRPWRAACALIAWVGCAPAIPEAPTYFGDVQPILQANCARCHGADPIEAKVAAFRLDRNVRDDARTFDVWDYRDSVIAHAVLHEAPAMPPDYLLTPRQQTLLQRWVERGAPKGTRKNALPTATAVSPPTGGFTVDQSLDLVLRSSDADGDGLLVWLARREQGSSTADAVAGPLGEGLRALTLDTGQWPSKRTFDLVAIVDDGFSDDPSQNAHEVTLLDDVFVDHGERGTAPTVALLKPNGGETLIGDATIQWTATDPDVGDVLTIDLELMKVAADGSETVAAVIATGIPGNQSTFVWNTAGVTSAEPSGALIRYKVRVTARDAGAKNTRADASDTPFTVVRATAPGSTNLVWADILPIMETYCLKCHDEPARSGAIEYFRLDKYDAADAVAPINSDDGVFEVKGLVYQRMVVDKTMPPNAEPQPSAGELAKVKEWILAGAPRASGPVDSPPVFSWTTPNDSAIAKTTSGTVTLRWTASDPEGQPFQGGGIAYVEIDANSDQLATCSASLTGWTTVAGVDVAASSHLWTAPRLGYFCFRGEVTDAAGQKRSSVATRPVKYSTR
jgi:hypothetical protein